MRFLLGALLCISSLCISQISLAQNLLTNPDLTADRSGWQTTNANSTSFAIWDDAVGYPTAGSALLIANFSGDTASFSQCVNISPQNVDLVGWSKVIYSGGSGYYGSVVLSLFNVPNCSATNIQSITASTSGTIVDGWREHRLMNYALPAYTQSVMVFLSVSGPSTGVNMDHVAFGPAGTVVPIEVIFSNSFEE